MALDIKGIQHSSLTGLFHVPFLALGSEQPGEKRLAPILTQVIKHPASSHSKIPSNSCPLARRNNSAHLIALS